MSAPPPVRHVRPRDAASVILVRPDASGTLTVLMGRRSRRAKFVPDVFVFPGGRVDAADQHTAPVSPLSATEAARLAAAGAAGPVMARRLATAAIRETWEETGYVLGQSRVAGETIHPDHGALRFAARAITPRMSPIRFHARFFLADGTSLTGDPAGSGELTDLAWFPLTDAQKLPVIDVTEFMLGQLETLTATPAKIPLFVYRAGRPAIRWLVLP
jgi:8-oxo-dGTP pyrophosphatase MutT (NUDIX family)